MVIGYSVKLTKRKEQLFDDIETIKIYEGKLN